MGNSSGFGQIVGQSARPMYAENVGRRTGGLGAASKQLADHVAGGVHLRHACAVAQPASAEHLCQRLDPAREGVPP